MLIYTNKCQILQGGSRKIKNDYEMRSIKIKSVHSVRNLGVTVTSNLMLSSSAASKSKQDDEFD